MASKGPGGGGEEVGLREVDAVGYVGGSRRYDGGDG